jgi:DNA-binding transcriptional LysR family regulator
MTWIMTSQERSGLGLCRAHTGLEKALGGPLFERHSRGVTPTALGRLSHT